MYLMDEFMMHQSETKLRVGIIGAGISGLAAARLLKSKGYAVDLLEARDYAGGRIKFDHTLGVPFPSGAAFVHGLTNNPIYQLLLPFNPKIKDFAQLPVAIFDKNKKIYASPFLLHKKNQFEQLLNASKKQMLNNPDDKSLYESAKYILTKQGKNIEDLNWDFLYLSMFTGIDAKYLSGKNWDQMGEFEGDYLLLTSYDPLINLLKEEQNIFYNTIVTEINYANEIVLVKTNKQDFEFDKVIITVPLGVLRNNSIKFSPILPNEKLTAINNLNMSKLNKIGLLFSKQFWPNNFAVMGYDVDQSKDIALFFNYGYFFDKPVLLGAVSGDAAVELESKGEQAFVNCTMKTLRKLFGKNIPEPIKVVTTNWCNDPYSFGSYSYIPVDGSGEDFDRLSKPVADKLFFAGEATIKTCHSTVQGAYESGIREASRLCKNK